MKLYSNNHSVFSLNYHLILVIKYRRKVIDDAISNRLKVTKLHKKIANQRKDFLHKVSKKLINENQVIVIEDLSVKSK